MLARIVAETGLALVDAAMNDLMRPTLNEAHHENLPHQALVREMLVKDDQAAVIRSRVDALIAMDKPALVVGSTPNHRRRGRAGQRERRSSGATGTGRSLRRPGRRRRP
jgi:hypothetical protein